MKNTTLCYIEKDGKYLMLCRNKKDNDENKDKWIGIGGKFEDGESPEDCVKREIFEETSLVAKTLKYCGIVTFVSDEYGTEYMHLFKCTRFDGEINKDCPEGTLEWIEKGKLFDFKMWEGDKIFLKLIEDNDTPFFSLKLVYKKDALVEHTLEMY